MKDLMKLEDIVDEHGISQVLQALAAISFEKSNHVQTNWQDENLAQAWDGLAYQLTALSNMAKELE